MKHSSIHALLLIAALLFLGPAFLGPAFLGPAAFAQEEPASDEPLEVFLELPAYGEPLFGQVEISARIYPPDAEVERVLFFLDGELANLALAPPFTTTLDFGEENIEHEIEVMAQAKDGSNAVDRARTPKIRTDEEVAVELQQLYVAVEQEGARMLDLERKDFTVYDNGRVQDLVTFETGDVPFTATLLVDSSTSMKGERLRFALRGVSAFVDGMRELDQAKLMLFSDRLLHEAPFTSFASVVTLGLGTVEAGGGTALNDHLYLALERLETRQGRRVVVILSDGIDVDSVLDMDHVRWKANQLQPVIYWIRLDLAEEAGQDQRSIWRSAQEHRDELAGLVDAVLESGGRIEPVERIEDIASAFERILSDLRDQYVLGYYSDSTTVRHDIDIRLSRPGLRLRTRGSYLTAPVWKRR